MGMTANWLIAVPFLYARQNELSHFVDYPINVFVGSKVLAFFLEIAAEI